MAHLKKKKANIRGIPLFGQRIEKPSKGKGSYTRKQKHQD